LSFWCSPKSKGEGCKRRLDRRNCGNSTREQRRIFLPRHFFNDRQRLRRIRRRDHRHAGLDDAGFFRRDFFQRVAEPLLVVERDVGDDAGQRRDDVGRVEPSAEAGFPDHQVAFLFRENFSAITVATSNNVG
jgi:hypothetical protein